MTLCYSGIKMKEKKSGALSKVQKLKKRLSISFGRLCECHFVVTRIILLHFLPPTFPFRLFPPFSCPGNVIKVKHLSWRLASKIFILIYRRVGVHGDEGF